MEKNRVLYRRDFFKLLTNGVLTISGLAGLGGIIRFFSYYKNEPHSSEYNLGPADHYPLGSKTIHNQVPAVLIHTEWGFEALSLTCTHLGCNLIEENQRFHCPCHGSNFGEDGSVSNGPAVQPLQSLAVELSSDGTLVIHTK